MPWGPDVFAGTTSLGAPNDPLVTADDFAEWYGVTLDSAGSARVETAVEIASAEVRSETQQQLSTVSETITIRPSGNGPLVLPQFPVTDVLSVSIDGSSLTETVDYVWERNGVVTLFGRWLYWPKWHLISVTYTHGWDPLPRDLAGVVLSRAKRLYDQPDAQQVEKESLGDWSVTYAARSEGFTDSECATLSRYASWTNGY